MALESPNQYQLSFQVEGIRYCHPDSDWSVLEVRNLEDSSLEIVTGVFRKVHLGEVICSEGSWQKHPVHGKQWNSVSFKSQDPEDDLTLVRFIHQVIFFRNCRIG